MALMATFLEVGDTNGVSYEDDNWQIREHCNRGYEPWFTLHKRKRFIGFTWWSGLQKWGDYKPLHEFVMRWNEWPNASLEGRGTPKPEKSA